jgi:hypothetical protein
VGPVTCLSFGAERKAMYPGYFFCHGCDLWEDAIMSGNGRANRKQKKYRCTGDHTDSSHPTTVKSGYRPNIRRNSPALSGENLDVRVDAEGKNAPTDKESLLPEN